MGEGLDSYYSNKIIKVNILKIELNFKTKFKPGIFEKFWLWTSDLSESEFELVEYFYLAVGHFRTNCVDSCNTKPLYSPCTKQTIVLSFDFSKVSKTSTAKNNKLKISLKILSSAARKFEKKVAKFLKTPKDLHQSNFKITKDLHQRPPKSQKFLHQSSKNYAKNWFKQVLLIFFKVARKGAKF